jgi:hypothetical protein
LPHLIDLAPAVILSTMGQGPFQGR